MVDVAFTPVGARAADVAIVIDALRATSSIAEALAGGYRRVRCVATLEAARTLAAPGRVLAGERHCLRPPGFDLGNSPADLVTPRGEELVLATTNGAPAIVRAAALTPVVLVACLRNAAAVAAAVPAGADVQIVCAGTDGAPSVEDTYVAGRLVALLDRPGTDAALIAHAVTRAYPDPADAFAAGAGGRALLDAGMAADIAWCAQESVLAVAPFVHEAGEGFALVNS
ncbi:MAG TPA: 2-phosphosulfolactate phosphatase [Solirubrobacter sp.]|nr:2-phosphosulfolactate phosphatase [Solirubrobacter sp.]